jgi:hypothetical protein
MVQLTDLNQSVNKRVNLSHGRKHWIDQAFWVSQQRRNQSSEWELLRVRLVEELQWERHCEHGHWKVVVGRVLLVYF